MALSCAPLRAVCARPGTLLRYMSRTCRQSGARTAVLWKPGLTPPVTSHVRGITGLTKSTSGVFLSPANTQQSAQNSSILSRVSPLLPSILQQSSRPVTYISLRKGKRKSVKSVPERFMRLHCGLWIRRKSGYKKKLWKKRAARKKRLREIVICNKTQSRLLDKMTTSFWKRRNWYVDDPYQKYHDRTNLKV
ncbi:PREDICTED: 39S ribosomal protein L35, mitochondrial [Nanorana parkeri]|uniref:39S ribosomal protein L35, mitochondrial n=1 Tax=Nanorana parkeri TaxID=125878 RepID=UPI0008547530|nr:PREDICTED: 39S ribosomal protein L35, mitochondrial [Nanorana parkeri]